MGDRRRKRGYLISSLNKQMDIEKVCISPPKKKKVCESIKESKDWGECRNREGLDGSLGEWSQIP